MSSTTQDVVAYLALGANQGDREGNFKTALQALGRVPGVCVLGCSPLVETAPLTRTRGRVDCTESVAPGVAPESNRQQLGDPYLNAVAQVRTSLSPHALLAVCKAQERAAGRVLPAPRLAPRPLDLDLLLYGEERVDTAELTVPHLALWERSFWAEGLAHFDVNVHALPRVQRPLVLREAVALSAQCSAWLEGGCVVGLVPTMGALHEGHASLLRRARRECDRVVATVFVNPLQFGEGEDFDAYPRTWDADLAVLAREGVDGVFAPSPAGMFGTGFCSRVAVGREADGLEGGTRPGHFEGVATVVARLFAMARPHRAYFGRKDAQQVAVLRRMVADLGFPLELVECPIDREADGLARSSRNVYLDPGDRQAATALYRALRSGRECFAAGGDAAAVVAAAKRVVAAEPRADLDYLELRREGDLVPIDTGSGPDRNGAPLTGGRLLVAAWFGVEPRRTRLIDNLSLEPTVDEVGVGAAALRPGADALATPSHGGAGDRATRSGP